MSVMVHGTKTKLAILLCNWKKRGFIVKNEDGTFSKTAKFIGKYGALWNAGNGSVRLDVVRALLYIIR